MRRCRYVPIIGGTSRCGWQEGGTQCLPTRYSVLAWAAASDQAVSVDLEYGVIAAPPALSW